mmetsp:Transcript_56655/g.120533  ORF Transcript_56655/g.120533 Transcript_56655/m.120533 type:complete len:534 (+) Transcript_56655:84-1685(+)
MLKEETKVLMASWKRAVMARSASTLATGKHTFVAKVANPSPVLTQQRHLQHVSATASTSVPSTSYPQPSSKKETPEPVQGRHKVTNCKPVNAGRQVEIEFADNSRYEFHAKWLKDSNPSTHGMDYYRTSAADVWQLSDFTVSQVFPVGDGQKLQVVFETENGKSQTDIFQAEWLYAFAPFVGKALNQSARSEKAVNGTSSLLEGRYARRKGWKSDLEMPTFKADVLTESVDEQIRFFESLICPGVCLIEGLGTPESLERESAGKPMEALAKKIVGKLNQHPVRSTNYGVMRKTAESAKQGADYDMSNPLSMHTDHSVYHGTPGFIQFLYQAEGSVSSKVCDGLALSEYVKEHHPDAYKLLTEVQMTHSSRNTLYTPEGAPRSVYDKSTEPSPFELVHTHPIIELNAKGQMEKVVQSETKRGVCALSYDTYEEWMAAYSLWTQLCEDPRFIKHFDWPEGSCVVTNNYRTLHGRATVPPEMSRTMAFGYVNKTIVENRYRYLKQLQTGKDKPEIDDHRWLTRIPNQVLAKIVDSE